MKQTFSNSRIETLFESLARAETQHPKFTAQKRTPVHVVYGGANLFKAETPQKLGALALKSLDAYAPDFAEFARAMWLSGADTLPDFEDAVQELEFQLFENEERVKSESFAVWFAWAIFNRTIEKLKREPVEDFRIDFEDGYGFRSNAEEDSHAIEASGELAKAFNEKIITPFCGFRIKSFAPETYKRAVRTLDLFLTNLLEQTGGILPENFVVTLPKITRAGEVEVLARLLDEFEKKNNLGRGAVQIEIMIETPQAIVGENGEIALRSLVEAGEGRVNSAHFGAYDYTASFGISGVHQHLGHDACNFARQMMQASIAPLGIRLSDSVTIEMPVPIHRSEKLTEKQAKENKMAVKRAWRKHFNNVTCSLINGFYQSWDLHPAQLVARYAAVYAFFLESKDRQAKRLKGFMEKAARANMTGNTFDDAASANGLLNFFLLALSCGAMRAEEIEAATGLTIDELHTSSFAKIMDKKTAAR